MQVCWLVSCFHTCPSTIHYLSSSSSSSSDPPNNVNSSTASAKSLWCLQSSFPNPSPWSLQVTFLRLLFVIHHLPRSSLLFTLQPHYTPPSSGALYLSISDAQNTVSQIFNAVWFLIPFSSCPGVLNYQRLKWPSRLPCSITLL